MVHLASERVAPGSPAERGGLRGGFVDTDFGGVHILMGGDLIVKVGRPVMLRLGLVEFLAQSVSRITDLPRANSLPTLTMRHAITGDETVANCITSLRLLATQDWDDCFQSVSRVEHILRTDPAHVYADMDQETRDRYRKVIEKLALATGQDEQAVARQAIDLAQAHASSPTARAAHVGYYLLDAGRAQLDARVGYRVPLSSRVRRGALDHPTPVYLGSIGLITFIVMLGGMLYARETGATFWEEQPAFYCNGSSFCGEETDGHSRKSDAQVKLKRQFDEYVSGLDSSSPDAAIQFEQWLDKEGYGIGDNDHVYKKNSKG